MVDQEVRERIVSIADLFDRFGRQRKLHEEELWARSEHLAEGSEVIRLVEPFDEWMTRVEQQVTDAKARTLANQLKLSSERCYMDQHFHQMNDTLTNLACRLNIVEEITKNWNRM